MFFRKKGKLREGKLVSWLLALFVLFMLIILLLLMSWFCQLKAVREMRDNYMKKLASIRGTHGKQWEEFLQHDVQRRQQQTRSRQQLSADAGFDGYKQPPAYPPEYDSRAAVNQAHYAGASLVSMDSRGKLPNSFDNNYGSSRHHDNYEDFPRQRREEYGRTYNRY